MRAHALTAAVAIVAALVASAAPVAASTAEDPVVSWSLAPATPDGPDGRSWVESKASPGETVTEHLAVRNLGETTTTFILTAADGYFTDTGRFSMLQAGETSVAAGTWVSVAPDVTVEPGATAVVPFTVTVPENATPGDHAAGIAASIVSSGTTSDGTRVGVESRVGFRVMTQVEGALAPALSVDDLSAAYSPSWNLFTPGEVAVRYTAENAGNTQLAVGETLGGVTTARGDLFPGETRAVAVDPAPAWPLGLVTMEVVVAASVPSDDDLAVAPVTRTVTFWAMPWLHLATLAGAALVVAALLLARRRSRATVERLVEEARAEGRREREEAVGSRV
jgi:hypothetical protein